MFRWPWKKKEKVPAAPQEPTMADRARAFNSEIHHVPTINYAELNARIFHRTSNDFKTLPVTITTDSAEDTEETKINFVKSLARPTMDRAVMDGAEAGVGVVNNFGILPNSIISNVQLSWFASQSFIGYQTMAMMSQQWLVDKACTMPAEDAIRKGFELTIADGVEISPQIKDAIKQNDIDYRLTEHLKEFVRTGRIFGIRVLLFKVRSNDPDYYFKPFNIDAVTPFSYQGMVQIDPYWMTPQLDLEATADPSSLHFYEPTWWQIGSFGRVHRSHLMIFKTGEVPDILKPTYLFGGVSIPQRIYERVYAAERTANEAPLLSLSKRTIVQKTDVTTALLNQHKFEERMAFVAHTTNNFGTRIIDHLDEITQMDLSLADLDNVIMTQFQLVAAIAEVPAAKLLGTSPKGFNATGEFEEASYHEKLESLQTHFLTPVIKRHHELVIRSEILKKFKVEPFETGVAWNPLDAMTAQEKAEVNKIRAEAGNLLVNSGAISPLEERERLIADLESGYNGLSIEEDLSEEPDAEYPDTTLGPDDDEEELGGAINNEEI